MALSTQPYKGARDFYPEDKRLQDYMFDVMRRVARSYGYEEYDAPIVEPIELYTAKSGEEIVREQAYNFMDRGGRHVTLRPEMTPTVSRMVAGRRQELGYPVRWFSIPNLWRYERPQRGRLREHWQLNVDIFGEAGIAADHEIITVADSILKAYGASRTMYEIRLNSRKFMDFVLKKHLGMGEVEAQTLTKLIDRMHKMERPHFEAEVDALCTPTQREQGIPEKVFEFLKVTELSKLPEELQSQASLQELRQLIALLEESGIPNVVFDPTLMRGFDYYTDIVFEVFDTNPVNNRSMFGGGRYDGLVALFGVDPVPTVGFGMGDVTLANFLEVHGLTPTLISSTELAVLLIGDIYEPALKVTKELREGGLNISVDATDRKLDKKLKATAKQGIRYALFLGEEELASEQYKLKDLLTGEESTHGIPRIISTIKDFRNDK
jgi:histidyl-tRNA synthetase